MKVCVCTINTAEKQYVKLRELILTVTVLLNKSSLAEYCSQHFYDSRITRFLLRTIRNERTIISLVFRPTTLAEDQSFKGKLR